MRAASLVVVCVTPLLVLCAALQQAQTPQPPRGPFGLSRLATPDGRPVDHAGFGALDDCSLCHARQAEEFDGSLHSASHHDPLYRAFAEMARREAGEEVYAFCSGCHAPAAVVSGLVPGTPESELPDNVTAGVQCDVCHQVRALTGAEGPWREPGNASLALRPDRAKSSIREPVQANPNHTVELHGFLETSEFCASCHTVIHPLNGLRIEHTYAEWKASVYAAKGIQCQDCHMRTVEDAARVARTLERVEVRGKTSEMSTEERAIHPHTFVGGNADAARLTGSAEHAEQAVARLRSAAELALELPPSARPGEPLAFKVAVTNVGAGHALPTSLTELREMWVHVRVTDANGAPLFESGALDEHGEIASGAARFGAELADAEGRATFKPWEAAGFRWKRVVAPKATERDTFELRLAAGVAGPLAIEARLLYRIAPPHVVREVMGEAAFVPRVVEMASARGSLELGEAR